MTGPKLDSAMRAVERLMVDACKITHDLLGPADDTLDPDTLEMHKPSPDAATLYEGACRVRVKDSGAGRGREEGGEYVRVRTGTVKLPLDSPDIPPGAVVEITESTHDEALVGRFFVVVDVVSTTLAIQRTLNVVQRTVSEDV